MKETAEERWERVAEGCFLERQRSELTPIECLAEAIKTLIALDAGGDFHAEHDTLYLPGDEELFWAMSDETLQHLSRLGVHYDTEAECFAMYC